MLLFYFHVLLSYKILFKIKMIKSDNKKKGTFKLAVTFLA